MDRTGNLMTQRTRIGVVGCGAMGSVYAARLARAGHDVLVVDSWAEHVATMNTHGITITGPDGTFTAPVRAFTQPPDRPVDLVIIAVKAADASTAASSLGRLVNSETMVLTIQNGLGSAATVADYVDPKQLAVGIAKGFGASLTGPGAVHHNAMRALRFGSHTGSDRPDVARLAEIWRAAGFDAEAVDDIIAMQWTKLICNAAYSGPCAVLGATVGEVLEHPNLGPISRAAARETYEVARACGVRIDFEPETLAREFAAGMPAAKPSVLLDIEAGRRSEIDYINGAVPREAAKVGLTAPINSALTALVHAVEKGDNGPFRF